MSEYVEKPYPNEHASRQREPSAFEPNSFRRIKPGPKGISFIIGKPKGSTKTEIQAIRFDKKLWTPAEAKAWLKEHGYKTTLEAASEKSEIEAGLEKLETRSLWKGVLW